MSVDLMSSKYPAAAGKFDAAMTFEEIGRELGITKQDAYFLFVSGLRKIRRNKRAMKVLRELGEIKASLHSRRATA